MAVFLFSTAYFAPVSYYAYMMKAETVLIEQYEHYHKQTYRNRCVIAAANGPMTLTLPVEKTESQAIRDIRISGQGNWRHLHWNSIESAYQSTPYFEYYQDDLRPFFEQKAPAFLFDFNEALREKVCELLNIHPQVAYTTDYLFEDEAKKEPTAIVDLRSAIHPKKDWHELPAIQPEKYTQVFDYKFGFRPEMSILDLLFNMGTEAVLVLMKNNRL